MMLNKFRLVCVTGLLPLICGCQSLSTPELAGPGCDGGLRETAGTGGVVHGAVRAQLDRAHAQRIVAITDEGDRG